MQRPVSLALAVVLAVSLFWRATRSDGTADALPVAAARAPSEAPVADGALDGAFDGALPTARRGAARSVAPGATRAAGTEEPGEEPATPDRSGCAVSVRVVDAEGGAPLAGFRLALEAASGDEVRRSCTTDGDGRLLTPAEWHVGLVVVEHEPSPEYPGDWRLEPYAVSIPEGARSRELEVVARHARHVVEVEVVLPGGAPAAGAKVLHALSDPDPSPDSGDEPIWRRWGTVETDGAGRARVALLPEEARRRALAFTLRDPFEGHVADRLVSLPPLGDSPHRLELYRGGDLEVRVVGERGEPLERTEVFAHLDDRVRVHSGPPRATEAGGIARYVDLAAGSYVARARYPGTDRWVAETRVELARGAHASVELVLPDASLPIVAAAGRVVDVEGAPVAHRLVLARLDDGPVERVFSREDGTFEYLTPRRGARVHLQPGASVFAEPYDPQELAVEFGATGIEFRASEAMELCVALFEVVDGRTGELLPDALDPAVVIYRAPESGAPVVAVARFGLAGGVGEVEFLPHADLEYWVTAPGFGESRGPLRHPGPDGAPPLHRVVLQPGFERALVVRDARDAAAIPGARFLAASGDTLGVTDGRGEVRLSAAQWPGELTVEREGYAPFAWDPRRYWMRHERTLLLEPLE